VSENPYGSPKQQIDVGRCLADGWAGLGENFPLWLFAGVIGLVAVALATVTVIVFFLIVPVLVWGSVRLLLNMSEGRGELGDLFAGFSSYGTTLLPTLILMLVLGLISFLGQSVSAFGERFDSTLLSFLGGIVGIAWGLLVTPRVGLAYFYLVDRDLGAIESVQAAWDRSDPAKWQIAILTAVTALICFAGALLFLIGLIPAIAMTYFMWASAYRQLEAAPARTAAI